MAILYEGPSQLDGAPIVAIATVGSSNVKTGPMIQTWILRSDMSPVEASKASADSSVCGDCLHRHSLGGACYVTLFQAPLSVWKAYKRGVHSTEESERELDRALAKGASVRLGAYGDPAAVPVEIWRALVAKSQSGHTGYTHQWRNPVAAPFRTLVMASCDSDEDVRDAVRAGWRYFRVIRPGDPTPARSVECLSESRGKTCAECRLCDGAREGRDVQPVSIWIAVHGARASRFTGKRSAALKVA